MRHYFYCAVHQHSDGQLAEYQSGLYTTDCPVDKPLFFDGLRTQIVDGFDIPCSTGQVVILSLSLLQ